MGNNHAKKAAAARKAARQARKGFGRSSGRNWQLRGWKRAGRRQHFPGEQGGGTGS